MKKFLFTISFMVILTIFFISILAFINESSKERIANNLEMQRYKSILYAFNILPDNVDENRLPSTSTINDIFWDEEKIEENFKKQIKKIRLPITPDQQKLLKNSFLSWKDSVDIFFQINKKGEIVAYGFPLKGKGLWGTITAFGVVSADFKKMVGIDFIEQVETPGLGARIIESEFKYFFRNLDLSGFQDKPRNLPAVIMVTKKNKTNIEQSTNSLQAITGATQTVSGVLAMLNSDLGFYITVIRDNEHIITYNLPKVLNLRDGYIGGYIGD